SLIPCQPSLPLGQLLSIHASPHVLPPLSMEKVHRPRLSGAARVAVVCAHNIAAVPEPSTCAMALAGLACGGYLVRRRRRAR
ncbi:MAG: PEP-CTERM sorting domain-containing protein, partial [Planctomycetota bacterium]